MVENNNPNDKMMPKRILCLFSGMIRLATVSNARRNGESKVRNDFICARFFQLLIG